jgi:3-hexulose-6-phosphate synthase
MDAGEMEADLAFDHGADIVTVLAAADDATIQAVVQSARKHCKEVMADMIAVPDINERALQVDKLGVDYICIHTAVDVYSSNSSVSLHKELATLTDIIDKGKLAVAGGIEPATIKEINAYDPGVVIVGSYITKSQNMAEAIKQVKSIMNSPRINIGVADDLENIIENLVRQIVQSIIKNGVAGND